MKRVLRRGWAAYTRRRWPMAADLAIAAVLVWWWLA